MATNDTPSNRDNLSSVSTILGLALFCLLIATILVRRVMVHRATRRYARQRLLAAATVVGGGSGGGGGVMRRGEDSLDDDEPRTIAIGARAALMKGPILWEQHFSLHYNPLLSEKCMEGAGNSCWDRLQPTALQLLTPHTTAHFPKPLTNHTLPPRSSLDPSPRRLSRAYERFLFHRDHSALAPSVPPLQIHTALSPSNPNAPPPSPPAANVSEPAPNQSTSLHSQQRGTVDERTAAVENQSSMERRSLGEAQQTSPEESPEGIPRETLQEKRPVSEDGVYTHPVHLTFLISMPDPTSTSTSTSNSNSNPPNLPLLSLGTTHPTARLPSIIINQDDLDSWWDLPTSSSPLPNNSNFGRSPTARRTPNTFEFQNVSPARLLHMQYANSNAHSHSHAHANGNRNGDGDGGGGNGGGTLSAGQILQLEIARRVATEREREIEHERVMSEGVGGRGGGGGGGAVRGNVYAGYSGLFRAAGVRRM